MRVFTSIQDSQVAKLLKSSAVGILPTDTVYGLVCRAADESAANRLYGLKAREHKPGTVIAANIEQLVELGIKYRYLKAIEQFWPNPISVEIPHNIEYLNQGTYRQAFRIPKDPSLLKLLNQTGPLLTSSANQRGEPTANTIKEAQKYFGDQVDFYVEGGDLSSHQPSTIIRIIDDAIEVVREGAVKIDETGKIEP